MDNWQNYPIAYPYSQFYAPSPWDVPNRFSLGASYLFPGEHMSNAIASRALGGWTLSGLVVLQSGYPFAVYTGAPLSVSTTAADGSALTSTNYAAELAANVSPRSLRVIKRQVYDAMFLTLAETFETSEREMLESLRSDDFKEGVAHFIEKRSPVFTGK